MNRYQRKQSKRIKRITKIDKFGRMTYKQARKLMREGVTIYSINGKWYRTNDYSELCHTMPASMMQAM